MPASQSEPISGNPRITLAVIAQSDERLREIGKGLAAAQARITHQFNEHPAAGALSRLIESGCDVIIVDLDPAVEPAIELIETICSLSVSVTVMACWTRNEGDVVIRAMRAGAREFLIEPLASGALREALNRAASRREQRTPARASGKILIFRGAKGGTGVTTIATNFAIALTKETRGGVVLVDLHPQLGDAALSLGMTPRFSIVDALANSSRLDADFLGTMLLQHKSGLAVLGSPEEHPSGASRSLDRGAEKLFRVLRDEFEYVVVDAGSSAGTTPDSLFEAADTIYLVTEANLPSLRNARRVISYLESKGSNLELVLNRFNSRTVEIDEASAAKALARTPDWKIPNDYMAVRGAQNLGVPLMEQDKPVSRAIAEMAKSAISLNSDGTAPISESVTKGEKWKFWTSSNTRPLSIARS
jgi:pilus assembly protein CpaE